MLLIGFSGSATAFEFSFGKRFLDYGNGAINLDKVTYVRHTLSYRIALQGDPTDEFSKEYTPSANQSSIDGSLSFLDPEALKKLQFYYIQISSRIFLDQFELTILSPKTFLKLPQPDQLMSVIEKTPAFKNFIDIIGPIKNIKQENSIDIYNALLKKDLKELTKKDFSEIKEGLNSTLKTYRKIVR